MTAATLPAAGLRPATLVLLDPPAVPHAVIAAMAVDPDERTYDDITEAAAAVRRDNPDWSEGDVLAKAEALTQLDEAAARSVLLDNGDWDGGLADLADPAAADIPVHVVRGDPTAGGLLPDAWLAAFEARIGVGRVVTITGGGHSPHRMHPEATAAAILAALEAG
jgi:pimeloyl-ACP methyl ester carboxylesterase